MSDLIQEQQRLPNQREIRKAAERRTGDFFLIRQPEGQSFPATHQLHTRGIWTESERKDLLKRVRDSSRMDRASREELLEKLWKDSDISWLRVPFDQLRNAVRRAQDTRQPVTPEVDKRVNSKWPGLRTFLRLLDENRVVNRGNAHSELRSLAPSRDHLIGWTLATPGVMVQFLKSGKLEQTGRNKLLEFGLKITIPEGERVEVDRIQVFKKSTQPLQWLKLVTKAKPVFESEAGAVGATEGTAGRFEFLTGGGVPFSRRGRGRVGFSVVYGLRRSDFHEQFHFYEDPKLQERIGGRWTFRILRLTGGERRGRPDVPESITWLARRADDPTPFIFRNDFSEERDQARKEKTDMLWNFEAIKTLERMGYFRDFNIEDELKKFKESGRSKKPPRNGVVRFRPRGRLSKAPEIFAE